MKYHGTALGLFTSDEQLDGPYAHRGIELCTVVEAMYSYEELFRMTGDFTLLDRLEMLSYNALPATLTPDLTGHQYVQQPNQISASIGKHDFFDVDSDANTFGIAPNYGCCTANMHQGFSKFTENLVYLNKSGGLTFASYAPFRLEHDAYSLEVSGEYPFKNKVKVAFTSVKSSDKVVSFEFHVPTDSTLTLHIGEEEFSSNGNMLTVERAVKAGDTFELEISVKLTESTNPDGSRSYWLGNLLMAQALKSEMWESKTDIVSKSGIAFNDRSYVAPATETFMVPDFSEENAQYYFCEEPAVMPFDLFDFKLDGKLAMPVVTMPAKAVFESSHKGRSRDDLVLSEAKVVDVEELGLEKGELTVVLIPYGCTKVRVAQFPIVENSTI
jgi:hypothetical protein